MVLSLMRSWQLVLLSLTTVALSVASGWTTWDGMSNFTRAPLLSFLITFGIQVIMLVTAWRIGEEFANRPRGLVPSAPTNPAQAGRRIGVLAATFGATAALLHFLPERLGSPLPAPPWTDPFLWQPEAPLLGTSGWASLAMAIALGLVAVAAMRALMMLVTSFRTAVEFVSRNIILWGMFVACMATSVFFSFDSLFAIVFPDAERARTAELRGLSRTGELIASITAANEKQRYSERRAVLTGTAWREYAAGLDVLAGETKAATQALSQRASDANAAKNRKDLQQKQSMTRLQVERQQLQQERDKLAATRDGQQGRIGNLQVLTETAQQQLVQKREELAAKKIQAKAEEIGAGTSGQIGKGPKYRDIAREIALLNLAISQIEAQTKAYGKEGAGIASEVAQVEKKLNEATIALADLDNRLAIETGEQAFPMQEATPGVALARLDENRVGIARAKEEFEKTPAREPLLALQSACNAAVGRLNEIGHPPPASDNCNASRVQEAASALFVLDAAAQVLKAKCGPQPAHGTERILFEQSVQRARACLEMSGLPAGAAARILADIDALERNRDDRAHRFIVTINAAQDGNRLAYLALALALGIDGLVFFAGVLGANAARSSLASLPRPWGFNIRRAEDGLRNALAPNALHTARTTLRVARPHEAMHAPAGSGADAGAAPTSAAGAPGVWSHVIDLQDPHLAIAHDVRRLINTAATMGAARRKPGTVDAYELRAELIAYLNEIPAPAQSGQHASRDPLDHGGLIASALAPDVHQGAADVVAYMTPSSEEPGYSSQIRQTDVRAEHEALLQRFVNAASAAGGVIVVREDGEQASRVLLHEQVCRVVVTLACPPRTSRPQPAAAIEQPRPRVIATDPAATNADVVGGEEPVGTQAPRAAQASAPLQPPPHAQAKPQLPQAPSQMRDLPQRYAAPPAQLPASAAQVAQAVPEAVQLPMPTAEQTAIALKALTNPAEPVAAPESRPQRVDVARPPASPPREPERSQSVRIRIQGDTISFGDAE